VASCLGKACKERVIISSQSAYRGFTARDRFADPRSSEANEFTLDERRVGLGRESGYDSGNGKDSSREFHRPFLSLEPSPVCWVTLSEPAVARISRIRRSIDRRKAKISKPFLPPFRMAARSCVSAATTTTRPNHRGSPPSSSSVPLPPLRPSLPAPRYPTTTAIHRRRARFYFPAPRS